MHHFAQLLSYTCEKNIMSRLSLLLSKYDPNILWYYAAIQSIHTYTKIAYKTMTCIILRCYHHTHEKKKYITSNLSFLLTLSDPYFLWYNAATQLNYTHTKIAYKTMPCIILFSCHHTHAKSNIKAASHCCYHNMIHIWNDMMMQSNQFTHIPKQLTRQCHASFCAAVIIHMQKNYHEQLIINNIVIWS